MTDFINAIKCPRSVIMVSSGIKATAQITLLSTRNVIYKNVILIPKAHQCTFQMFIKFFFNKQLKRAPLGSPFSGLLSEIKLRSMESKIMTFLNKP